MGKYFKIFKLDKSNICENVIILEMPCNVFPSCADLFTPTVYIDRDYTRSYNRFHKFLFRKEDYSRILNSWAIILYHRPGENIREIIQDLYTELGSLEVPEEEQIGCYTYLINLLNGG